MFKVAFATIVCSLGLVLCSDTAQARCCRRSSSCCCNPAPTCCTPAPCCAAPAATPAATTPATDAPEYDAAPPVPEASTSSGSPAVAMSPDANGRQTYRSFSYDSNSQNTSNSVAAQPRIRGPIPDSLKYRADRKMMRNY
jgi:hypothetical protein